MHLRCKIERKIEQSGERSFIIYVSQIQPQRRGQLTTTMSRGEALESILQDMGVCFSADLDGVQLIWRTANQSGRILDQVLVDFASEKVSRL